MRLCTFVIRTHVGRHRRLGLILAENVLDLNFATAWRFAKEGKYSPQPLANVLVPSNMLDFIRGGETALAHARETVDCWALERADLGPDEETLVYVRNEVHLITPLPNPPSIRDFYAFQAHVEKGFEKRGQTIPQEWFEMPVYYKVASHNLLGTDADVHWPSFTQKVDYEMELAAIIGREGSNVNASDATPYIFAI